MPKWEDFKHAASHEDCVKYDLNPNLRDNCSALLIPLQICRVKENYMPWKCKHERCVYAPRRDPACCPRRIKVPWELGCSDTSELL